LSRFLAKIYYNTIFAYSGLSMPPPPPDLSEFMMAEVCWARVAALEIMSGEVEGRGRGERRGQVARMAPGCFLEDLEEKDFGSLFCWE